MTYTIETVLIVEDEESLADLYARLVGTEYETMTAYSGEAAVETIDETVDAVFLDRKMPGIGGGEVLTRLREQGYEVPVAMITAVRPDWDVIDMRFDDYLLKPVDTTELIDAVDRLEVLGSTDREVREFIRQTVKQAALEGEKEAPALDSHEPFETLKSDVADMSSRLGDITAELSPEATELVVETITRNLGAPGGAGEADTL
ncbi:response regulator [Halorientalis sp.]|jgi:DNA-binding response OmpR family regulator|uniref:response regulator n=1 Tax=Halorientalis sp. TaxID=1931229 RepID=UPI002630759B|nr:response regulator [Halorientalis sp.]